MALDGADGLRLYSGAKTFRDSAAALGRIWGAISGDAIFAAVFRTFREHRTNKGPRGSSGTPCLSASVQSKTFHFRQSLGSLPSPDRGIMRLVTREWLRWWLEVRRNQPIIVLYSISRVVPWHKVSLIIGSAPAAAIGFSIDM